MQTVTEQVIHAIREKILNNEYWAGQHLQEVSLASTLNVSRTPIRDALRVLANEGLLEYSPNRGYVVRDVDLRDVLDAYDVRATLEGMACRLAAEHGLSDEDLERFQDVMARADRLFETTRWRKKEMDAWRSINDDFHDALLLASRNRQLKAALRQAMFYRRIIANRVDSSSSFYKEIFGKENRQMAQRDHVAILGAIINRQSARAEFLMREHILTNREAFRKMIEHGNGLDP